MSDPLTNEKEVTLRERPIVSTPSLTSTLMSLNPGDFVHCGSLWSYGTIRETASKLGVKIATRRSGKNITVMRAIELPEPK